MAEVVGSIPIGSTPTPHGGAERHIFDHHPPPAEIVGSIPLRSTSPHGGTGRNIGYPRFWVHWVADSHTQCTQSPSGLTPHRTAEAVLGPGLETSDAEQS
jgi:hypothetical protein